jgi:hypothetical protein
LSWTLTDDDWDHIDRAPSSDEDMAQLAAIWLVMKSKDPYLEFHHEDAQWGAQG